MVKVNFGTDNEKNYTLYVVGEIDLNTVDILENAINQALEKKKNLIIDMTDVKFIDSTGIGLLVQTYKKLKQDNNTITVLNARENVRKVFKITCLEETFNMGV